MFTQDLSAKALNFMSNAPLHSFLPKSIWELDHDLKAFCQLILTIIYDSANACSSDIIIQWLK